MDIFSDPAIWAGLATLTTMEIVLGIDNVVFISILAGKLPQEQQKKAINVGLGLAAGTRILMLFGISVLVGLTDVLFTISIPGTDLGHGFSGRDLILLGGGAFLIYKAVKEIHEKLEGEDETGDGSKARVTFGAIIMQILLLDIIFSLDSVITAVGMVDELWVMITAMLIALVVMILGSTPIAGFVQKHPTVKMLALSFLLLIGVTLAAEAFHSEIPKGYIYSAMAFSVIVEILNLMAKRRREAKKGIASEPVHLKQNVVGMNVQTERAEG